MQSNEATSLPIPEKPHSLCLHCDQPFEYLLTDDLEAAHKAARVLGFKAHVFWNKVPHETCDKHVEQKKQQELQEWKRKSHEDWYNTLYSTTLFLPEDVYQKTFENYRPQPEDQQAIELVKSWESTDTFGVFLMGAPGSGKTHLMQALFNKAVTNEELLDRRKQVCWFPVALGLDKIRSEMQASDDSFKQKALKAQFLFLDDLGVENATDWGREQLYIILDYRLSQNLPTFISTNLTVDEVRARYHERFLSRVKENSFVVQLKASDFRTNKVKHITQTLRDRLAAKR